MPYFLDFKPPVDCNFVIGFKVKDVFFDAIKYKTHPEFRNFKMSKGDP